MRDSKQTGQHLKTLREKRGWSLAQVTQTLNFHVGKLNIYENGDATPNDAEKEALADLYNITVQDLFFPDQEVYRRQERRTSVLRVT